MPRLPLARLARSSLRSGVTRVSSQKVVVVAQNVSIIDASSSTTKVPRAAVPSSSLEEHQQDAIVPRKQYPGFGDIEKAAWQEATKKSLDMRVGLCQKLINYVFKDKAKCVKALWGSRLGGPGAPHPDILADRGQNRALAILGDALLAKHVALRWYITGAFHR